jgi:hypothetical protein
MDYVRKSELILLQKIPLAFKVVKKDQEIIVLANIIYNIKN